MRRIVAALLAGLAACASPTSNTPPPPPLLPADQSAATMAVELTRISIRQLRDYTDALLLCGSAVPSDWAEGRKRLDIMHPFHVFREDPALIEALRKGDAGARKELARRGGMLRAMLTFGEKYERAKWDEARKTLLAAGEAGEALLTTLLLQLLIDAGSRPNWEHLRYQLVESGKPALETTTALARGLAEKAPAETALFASDDLTQLFLVLIAFGDAGRPAVEEFSRHEKPNVRRCMAQAIGEARDDVSAATLARYLTSDPSWIVRAAAAEACRRMGPSRRLLGPLLAKRVGEEKEGYVLRRVLRAIGDIGWADGVPALIAALESPSLETAEAAMAALYVLTGERHNKRERWVEWYRANFAAWKAKQPR
jgi:hypothetical protein